MAAEISLEEITQRALAVMAKRHVQSTEAIGGTTKVTNDYVFSNSTSLNPWDNGVLVNRELEAQELSDVFEEALQFFGDAGFVVLCPWEVPNFDVPDISAPSKHPLMVRSKKLEVLADDSFDVREILNAEGIEVFKATAKEGWESENDIKILDERTIHNPFNIYVGYQNDRPITTAVTTTLDKTVLIEIVATVPRARGKGYGGAITTFATNAAENSLGVLLSSAKGVHAYERVGFETVSNWIIWVRQRPA